MPDRSPIAADRAGREGIPTLIHALCDAVQHCPERTAIECDGAQASYHEFGLMVARIAAKVESLGLAKGDRVGISVGQSVELLQLIYGVMASASIGQLFAAGFIPGLLMAAALMMMVAWYAHRRNYPRDAKFAVSILWATFKRAFLSLMTPIIIVGGILTGVFTPTEAATAAVIWAMVLGFVVYRTLNLRRFVRVSMETIETTAIILLIVAGASIFAWLLTSNRVTEQFANLVSGVTDNKILILILLNIILFIVGFFMETVAAITILVPVLLPLAVSVGVDPVHFGVIMVLNLMIGLLTPPVGMVLYVLSRVSGVSFERCTKATLPFLIPLVTVLMLITFVPEFSMWLPTLIYR